MSHQAIAAPLLRARLGSFSAAIASVALVALIALAGIGVDGMVHGGRKSVSIPLYSAPAKAFRMALPNGWHAVAPAKLASLRPAPAAMLERSDRRATIVVRPAPALLGTPAQVTAQLTLQLGRRFPGFKPVSAHIARLRSGSAILYTFVRNPAGTVQTLAIAPAHGRLWEIDAVVRGRASGVARQVGSMLATFGS